MQDRANSTVLTLAVLAFWGALMFSVAGGFDLARVARGVATTAHMLYIGLTS